MDHAPTDTIRAGSGQFERALSVLRSLADAYARRRRKTRAIAALHDLNDRALADIGLSRSDIESVVWSRAGDPSRRYR